MKRFIRVAIGPVCVGKSTFLKSVSDDHLKIDIGNIVRELTQIQERTHYEDLDVAIINRLRDLFSEGWHRDIVIVGARQLSIVKWIDNYADVYGMFLQYILLDAPQEILEKRYELRAAIKDTNLTFQQAIARDVSLGYNETVNYINTKYPIKINCYDPNELELLNLIQERQKGQTPAMDNRAA